MKHDFAFNPDTGPPRLIRYVDSSMLPPGVVCDFDSDTNLLRVNRELYNKLDDVGQHQVLRTRQPAIEVAV
jgi:hypothetical protein